MKCLFSILLTLLIGLPGQGSAQDFKTPLYDFQISQGKMDPIFNSKKIILFGSAGHENTRTADEAIKYIERYGRDENLKRIFFEADSDLKDIFLSLSTKALSEKEISDHWSKNSLKSSICAPYWAYLIKYFFPVVQKINLSRKTKLLVLPIDSMSSDKELNWPALLAAQTQGNTCDFKGPVVTFVDSHARENLTAQIFLKELQALSDDDKVFVIYHSTHLVRGATSCRFDQSPKGNWSSSVQASSWFEKASLQDPRLRSSSFVILLDEIDSFHSPQGIFHYSERFNQQHSFLFFLRPGEASDITLNKSVLTDLFDYPQNQLDKDPSSLFDAVWWNPSSQTHAFPSEQELLPLLCGDDLSSDF